MWGDEKVEYTPSSRRQSGALKAASQQQKIDPFFCCWSMWRDCCCSFFKSRLFYGSWARHGTKRETHLWHWHEKTIWISGMKHFSFLIPPQLYLSDFNLLSGCVPPSSFNKQQKRFFSCFSIFPFFFHSSSSSSIVCLYLVICIVVLCGCGSSGHINGGEMGWNNLR